LVTVDDTVVNQSGQPVTLHPYALLAQHGLPADLQPGIVHEGAIGYVGDQYVSQTYGAWEDHAAAPKQYTAGTGWIGITGRYFFAGIIPDQTQSGQYRITYRAANTVVDPHARPRYQVDVQGAALTIAPGAQATSTTRLFTGAKKLRLLEEYEKQLGLVHFDLVVDFGWFYFLTKPFYYALVYLNDWVGNFGVAILLLTLILRIAVFPLANTSFKSFAKMKKVSPQIQELQKNYAHDKKKMQEELVKLYTREKVNPVSGCLPILAQIPIFFAMYKVISVAIEMRHAPFFGWIQDLTAPDPTSILNLFGLLPFDVHSFFHFGIWPCVLFVLIMLQVRLSPPPQDRMMQIFFNYYYPVIVCFIMAKFAAGLVIYWAFSAFLSIAQQIIIMRSMDVPVHLFERWKKDKPAADGPAP
jgi:YidC/Oxa1 family membrane protein insertase